MKQLLPKHKYLVSLLGLSLTSIGFYVYGAIVYGTNYSYLIWNLTLSWIPLLTSVLLAHRLRAKLWSSWELLAISLVWLLFLPNSFYMISDFIHLRDGPIEALLYNVLTFAAFIFTGVILGYTSLYIIHRQFLKRFTDRLTLILLGLILFACSVAIYIGRDLRWNSWDVLANPSGLIFDISDRLIHPQTYPQMFLIIFAFFYLLSALYAVIWQAIRALRYTPGK